MTPIDFGVTRLKVMVRGAYVSFDISCLFLAVLSLWYFTYFWQSCIFLVLLGNNDLQWDYRETESEATIEPYNTKFDERRIWCFTR